ncbi:MAG: Tol-Pal system beta propeller repeat protein TolB [Sulfuricellaceae bacterium]|nr:Tol-Pal system beta propeller repeat protein TolB [Sulfuricellaceae bacterium]
MLGLLAAQSAHAALDIEIIGSGATQIPIAVVPFAQENTLSQSITGVVTADLTRSGLFRSVETAGVTPQPYQPSDVRYPDWRSRGADALVIGSVAPTADGRLTVQFRLMDTVKQTQLAGLSYTVTPGQLRLTAHRIADIIYEKLTGDAGVFSTRIAYIVKQGRNNYELQVADADGYGPQTMLRSREPIISPAWAPDGMRLAYVSFEQKKPVIYVQSLQTGKRMAVAAFKGNNSAPAWSPDGSKLAVVLTRDGNSQIYSINADGSGLKRISHSPLIDTEPNWSPDGQWILFTSDRGGSPQIYRMTADGGPAARLTFDGSYNASPHYSPDGKSFTFIQRLNGQFHVAVQDIASSQVQVLTDTRLDESPSFAPNGKIILYATEIGGRGVLAAVSSDGRVKQRLTVQGGDVREPAWGPLLKN